MYEVQTNLNIQQQTIVTIQWPCTRHRYSNNPAIWHDSSHQPYVSWPAWSP